MARSINDREAVLARRKLPQKNLDRDTTLTLSLQVVFDQRGLERALPKLLRLLLKLLNRPLVNAAALVGEMARRRRLARVNVADDNDVGVILVGHLTKHLHLKFKNFGLTFFFDAGNNRGMVFRSERV